MNKSVIENAINNNVLAYEGADPDKCFLYFYTAAGTFRAKPQNVELQEGYIYLTDVRCFNFGGGSNYPLSVPSPTMLLEYGHITAITYTEPEGLGRRASW